MPIEHFIIGAFLVALVLHPILMRWLLESTHSRRAKLADVGQRLLASPDVSEHEKYIVSRMLDDAFDWKVMVLYTFALPVNAIRRYVGRGQKAAEFGRSGKADRLFEEFATHFVISTAAANPYMAFFVFIEALVIAAIRRLAQGWNNDGDGTLSGVARVFSRTSVTVHH